MLLVREYNEMMIARRCYLCGKQGLVSLLPYKRTTYWRSGGLRPAVLTV